MSSSGPHDFDTTPSRAFRIQRDYLRRLRDAGHGEYRITSEVDAEDPHWLVTRSGEPFIREFPVDPVEGRLQLGYDAESPDARVLADALIREVAFKTGGSKQQPMPAAKDGRYPRPPNLTDEQWAYLEYYWDFKRKTGGKTPTENQAAETLGIGTRQIRRYRRAIDKADPQLLKWSP